jgi:hypothetical protein
MSVDDLIRILQELKNTGIETQLAAIGLTMGLEPMTAITDAILAAWTAFLAALLFARAQDATPVKLWACAFLAAVVSSLAGVAYHGGRILFTPTVTALCWKIGPITTGLAALCLGSAAASVWLAPRARRIAFALLGLELVVCVVAAIMSNSFKVAAYDYVPVLLALLVGCGLHWGQPAARLIASGIVVSFIAFAIQASTLRISAFDHNDIFHLVQAAAMYLLYRGGAALAEVQASDADSRHILAAANA